MSTSGRPRHYDTKQRRAILDTLARSAGFVSAQTLQATLYRRGIPIALTTIYRALHAYAETGHIATTHNPGGEQLFRLAPDPRHNHYLVCHTCDANAPIDTQPVQEWAVDVRSRVHG